MNAVIDKPKRLSVRKDIEQKGNQVIEEAEKLIEKLIELDDYAKQSNRPHMHYFCFKTDLQSSVNRFKRMLR